MSEQAPEKTGGGGGGNVFTRKVGPLPLWAWLAIATVLAVFYSLYQKSKSSASNAPTGSGASTAGAGGVDASLVPQFVNQTYVNNTPPTAPPASSAPPVTGPSQPGYGKAGPPNANYAAITNAEANILESNSNTYNTSGQKAQRPFIWNGSAYVPNTNPITESNQYYAGPLEMQEINTAVKKGTVSSTGVPITTKKPATKAPTKK